MGCKTSEGNGCAGGASERGGDHEDHRDVRWGREGCCRQMGEASENDGSSPRRWDGSESP